MYRSRKHFCCTCINTHECVLKIYSEHILHISESIYEWAHNCLEKYHMNELGEGGSWFVTQPSPMSNVHSAMTSLQHKNMTLLSISVNSKDHSYVYNGLVVHVFHRHNYV